MKTLVSLWVGVCLIQGSFQIGISPLKKLHRLMTQKELQNTFDTKTGQNAAVPDYDIVYLRMRRDNPSKNETTPKTDEPDKAEHHLDYNVTYRGQTYSFSLKQNENLISPNLKIFRRTEGDKIEPVKPKRSVFGNCHYLGQGENSIAALSTCHHQTSNGGGGMKGILLLDKKAVSVKPLPDRIANILKRSGESDNEEQQFDLDDGVPHVLEGFDQEFQDLEDQAWDDEYIVPVDYEERAEGNSRLIKRGAKDKYLELAVFVDQAAYESFVPFTGSEDELREMILGFINQIQALYYQPSLKEKLTLSLVRLEFFKKQPSDLPHYDGERDKLLTSFCKYQSMKNPSSDDDPNHWDMALYVSGLNFYAMENGKKNEITMGLAPVGGVCNKDYACVIAEFGVTNEQGKPYPSAGMMATYVAAHEMGHNLGMLHDGAPANACPSNGFVMSPSRGTKGETSWSTCSADLMKSLDKSCLYDKPSSEPKERDQKKFHEQPGQVWDAYDQCKIFLRNNEAVLYNETVNSLVCEQILCRAPGRMGHYSAGPALDGTFCDDGKWCKEGKCVSWGSEKVKVISGGWSNWDTGSCTSGCLENAMGAQADKRKCDSPKPQNTKKYCDGEPVRVKLCDDKALCKSRETPDKYASRKCKEFSSVIDDVTGEGTQVPHNDKRPFQACAIYCKTKGGTWYTPVQELGDRGMDPYFPDGTRCHTDGKRDYFCQQHDCVISAKGRSLPTSGSTSKVDISNNARPDLDKFLSGLREYFQYDRDQSPKNAKVPEDLAKHDDDSVKDDDTVATIR